MKQVTIARHGDASRLTVREVALPEPGPGQLRITVRAAGVNFADILIRRGLYPGAPKLPCVVGHEVSGVVEAVGEGVDPIWIGRAVLALTDYGGYSECHVLDAHRVLPKPDGLDHEHAAALPLNYVTAWVLLVVMGSLRADQTVLIHNAGGGVGLAAIDVARHLGARTIGTASPGKHPFLLSRGLDHAIDYRQDNWQEEFSEVTRGQGVDLVLDPLGPASWQNSLTLLGPAGRLGMFGISQLAAPGLRGKLHLAAAMLTARRFHPARLIRGNRGIFGCNIHQMYDARTRLNTWLGQILRGVGEGWVRPHVDRVFDFESACDAHTYIEERRNTGKVILSMSARDPL
ncbi:MAG: zinc-binding dehydrogenase [Gammaproteobacteria bacterium]|nr:MAG: zinc-binding dehydrogenase [Gammaproteobacteria bacterium]